jgi:hypothetical protein
VSKHRIFTTKFSAVYPLYVQKAERKNRTQDEVDQIIRWLTGYDKASLDKQITQQIDFETFFAQAPAMNPQHIAYQRCCMRHSRRGSGRSVNAKNTLFG